MNMSSAHRWLLTAALSFSSLLATAAPGDEQAVSAALKKQFDKPDAPLEVSPVTVEGDHALAGWIQGQQGGRALLKRHGPSWEVVVCGGDDLQRASLLTDAGVNAAAAQRLTRAAAAAEARLPASQRQQFSLFKQTIRLQPGQAHGPASHGASAPAAAPPPH